ncbi:hypothetical protein QW71_03795 [Paenibacillus sp. IHB B 3415]|nr:hypothetical protein QW71_03795 [Paenibacillus sp. IHB B 3415]
MERNTIPEIHSNLHNNVAKFIKVVIEYLKTMQEQGLVVKGDPETQALTYHLSEEKYLGPLNSLIEEFCR